MKLTGLGLATLAWLANCAADDIYQYQTSNGTMVYTNKPVKNAKKVKLPPLTVYSAPMTKNDFTATGYTAANSQAATKPLIRQNVIANYGAFNETGRNQILNEELTREKQALSDSQQALATARQSKLPSEANHPAQYQARIQALQDAVTEHQKNIALLSQQLGEAN